MTEAIQKELELKKNELHKAYVSANKDQGQVESMKEWNETLEDGADDR